MYGLEWDKKALMYGRVVNKKVRHNLCFAEEAQEADYEAGKGTIVAYDTVPTCKQLRASLGEWFGEKAVDMNCEGNAYYDWKTCKIGEHGDKERKRVIAVRIGHSMPLWYQWYLNGEKIGKRFKVTLNHGDMYIMNEKSTGYDTAKRKIPTLRHAAGTEEAVYGTPQKGKSQH
jgi:hypothetical protein